MLLPGSRRPAPAAPGPPRARSRRRAPRRKRPAPPPLPSGKGKHLARHAGAHQAAQKLSFACHCTARSRNSQYSEEVTRVWLLTRSKLPVGKPADWGSSPAIAAKARLSELVEQPNCWSQVTRALVLQPPASLLLRKHCTQAPSPCQHTRSASCTGARSARVCAPWLQAAACTCTAATPELPLEQGRRYGTARAACGAAGAAAVGSACLGSGVQRGRCGARPHSCQSRVFV